MGLHGGGHGDFSLLPLPGAGKRNVTSPPCSMLDHPKDDLHVSRPARPIPMPNGSTIEPPCSRPSAPTIDSLLIRGRQSSAVQSVYLLFHRRCPRNQIDTDRSPTQEPQTTFAIPATPESAFTMRSHLTCLAAPRQSLDPALPA